MKNAETPVDKIVLYGAMSSLGSALMVELLRRQQEVICILDDLTALAPRPGLRFKAGSLFEAAHVSEAVAGATAVIVLLDAPILPTGAERNERTAAGPDRPVKAVQALTGGMQRSGLRRLVVVGDFAVLQAPAAENQPQRRAVEAIGEVLAASTLAWTLVNAPPAVAGLTFEHFSQISSSLEPGLAEPLDRLGRVAAGIADELHLKLHLGECMNFVC